MIKQKESEQLSRLSPARREEIAVILGRLSLHYSLGTAQENEIKLLMQDYIDDLSGYSAESLEAACRAYRKDPNSMFFPKVGQLIELAREHNKHIRSDVNWIARDREQIESKLASQPERADPEIASKLVEELRANLQAFPEEKRVTFTPPDKTYFERKIPNKNQSEQECNEPGGLLR